MDVIALMEAVSKLGAVGVLAMAVYFQEKRSERQQGLLERMIERLARIDVRTAEGDDAAPTPVKPERSRKFRRPATPTPFTGDDSEPRGGR